MGDKEDETSVGLGPADQTEVVTPAAEPEDSDGLAWSQADTDEYRAAGYWRDRLLWAGLVMLLVAVTAATIWLATAYFQRPTPVATPAPNPVPAAAPTIPAAPSPPLAPTTVIVQAPPPAPVAAPPVPSAASAPITQQQARTICRWLRDPAWAMPQIESSTGDMLADDNESFTESDVFNAIGSAMSTMCPDAHRSF
jgi:hypothetical protein